MEIQFMEHIRHSLLIDRNKDLIMEKLLNLTLEIICLLTREDFIVVRKSGDHVTDGSGPPVPDRCSRTQSPITEPPPPSPIEKNQEPTKMFHGETERVPVKCKDVEVPSSVTEWDYSEEHKNIVVGTQQPHNSKDIDHINPEMAAIHERDSKPIVIGQQEPQEKRDHPDVYNSAGGCSRNPRERCETPPLYSQDCIQEESRMITQDYKAEPGDGTFQRPCKEEAVHYDISSGCDTANETGVDHRGHQEFLPESCAAGQPVSSHYPVKMHHCSECPECFPNHSDLIIHQKTHSANNLFSCSICRVHFGCESAFLAHQRSHTEDKSFDCSYCGKFFSRRSRLLSHKRTHTGERPFSCPVCGRCFAERSALVTHHRIHSGEKPFHCTECGKRFVQRSSLVKHQRIHTGERPFVCFQCSRSFSDSSNLVRHQRTHFKEKSSVF